MNGRDGSLWHERVGLAVAVAALVALFFLLLADVILRPLRIPFYWGNEGSSLLMAWLLFFALPMVTRTKTHIVTDFLVARLPARNRRWMDLLSGLLMLAYLLILGWVCTRLTYGNWLNDARAQGILRLPLVYIEGGMVLGMAMVILTQAAMLVEQVRDLIRGERP